MYLYTSLCLNISVSHDEFMRPNPLLTHVLSNFPLGP